MFQKFFKMLKKSDGIKFIVYPIVFFLINAIIICIAFGPVVQPYFGMIDLVFLQKVPEFDKNIENIYKDGTAFSGKSEIHRSEIRLPISGEEFGKIIISSVNVDAPLIYGDAPKQLRRGVGLYEGCYLPGESRTVLAAGHNNSYFRTLKNVKSGDIVELRTNYGNYKYEITGSKIARFNDTTAYDLTKQTENLILYTCHEVGGVGATPYRVFVYAKYISGPKIV